MILNSDFKDYYDTLFKYGTDKAVVYNRKEKRIHYPKKTEWVLQIKKLLNIITPVNPFPYDASIVMVGENLYTTRMARKGSEHCNFEEFTNVDCLDYATIESINKNNMVILHGHKQKANSIYRLFDSNKIEPITKHMLKEIQEFTESPIVKFDNDGMVLNCNLSNTMVRINPHLVITELEKFFQTPEPTIVEVGNKYKVKAHGFDERSFKREKGGPTRKRKKIW